MSQKPVKDTAVIFFSELPIASLAPHPMLVRITGNIPDALAIHRALIYDMLGYFYSSERDYDYIYFYAPLRRGQKVNFLQLEDTLKIRLKNKFPQDKHPTLISMAHALKKALDSGYEKIVLIDPLAVVLDFSKVLSHANALKTHDVIMWRQGNGNVGVFAIKAAEGMIAFLDSVLSFEPADFSQALKESKYKILDIAPPLSTLDALFNYSPGQIIQYYPELRHFAKLIGK